VNNLCLFASKPAALLKQNSEHYSTRWLGEFVEQHLLSLSCVRRAIIVAHALLPPRARALSMVAVTSPKPIIQHGKLGGIAQNNERGKTMRERHGEKQAE
jgi:hypothetical protein